ncbi:glutamine--fructose-6-phosphate transaminase (isomerizing) [bacterium]|nr:glutamine--fructose-6-phosphate transaminase (isomerizing) [bacterium]
MCGIVAYSGSSDEVLPTLISGLKRLEYRGYDSAGVAIQSGKKIEVRKAVGKIVELEQAIATKPIHSSGSVGIAHIRWATHGLATVHNAHPHSSADRRIWLVHNGIIENYQEIRSQLEKQGIKFESETDTEVVAKLIGTLYSGDIRAAVLQAIKQLKGAYALAVVSQDEPGRLIGVKLASPMVVGVGHDEMIIASDVSAIIDRTKKVIYLEDGELIDVRGSDYEIVGFDEQPAEHKVEQIDWDLEAATKQGFDSFLLKEIMEQPRAIEDSIRGRIVLDDAMVKFGGLIDVRDRLKDIDQVVLLGIGTSYYSAKLGELYFNALTDIPTVAVMAPEFRYNKNNIGKNTWLIALSQSGETADTIAAIEEAKRHGVLATGIVNVVGSTIARITDAGVYNHIGPEISVASTKAFTSQSLILLMHAILLGRSDGLDFGQAKSLLQKISQLPGTIAKVLEQCDEIGAIAHKYEKAHNLLYIGRQYNYPVALEGALKIKEISYTHAEGLSAGELKHGFIALVDEHLPTIALATADALSDKMMANIEEVKARKGPVVAVANEKLSIADDTIVVPSIGNDLLQPIVNNIALQIFAYSVARARGLNIDQPRNLAKSVTVE